MITKNDFEVWQYEEVTQAFLAEIAERLKGEYERLIIGTPDEITRIVHARNEAITIFKEILEWKPQEIINQEE